MATEELRREAERWGRIVDPDATPLEVIVRDTSFIEDMSALRREDSIRFIFELEVQRVDISNIDASAVELRFSKSVSQITVRESRGKVSIASISVDQALKAVLADGRSLTIRGAGPNGRLLSPMTEIGIDACHTVSIRNMNANVSIDKKLLFLEASESVLAVTYGVGTMIRMLTVLDRVCITSPLVVDELRVIDRALLRCSRLSCGMFRTGDSADSVLSVGTHQITFPGDEHVDERGLLEIKRFGVGAHVDLPEEQSEVRINGLGATGLRVSGGGLVSLRPGATVNDMAAVDGHSATPRLSVGPYATIANLQGEFFFDSCEDSRVAGIEPDGFIFMGVRTPDPAKAMSGAVIENVAVRPSDHRARTLWAQLGNAAIVVPTKRAAKLDDYAEVLRKKKWTPDDKRHLGVIAAAAREMAGVADSRGAPGSIRSHANWSAYYMRQLTAPSVWERRLLWCYRWIGYGERPLMPFGLWMAGSILLSFIFNIQYGFMLSWEGALNMLDHWSEWVIPTLSLLNLGDAPSGPIDHPALRFVAHSILAIPFVTGVLALRNFVKADRPNR